MQQGIVMPTEEVKGLKRGKRKQRFHSKRWRTKDEGDKSERSKKTMGKRRRKQNAGTTLYWEEYKGSFNKSRIWRGKPYLRDDRVHRNINNMKKEPRDLRPTPEKRG